MNSQQHKVSVTELLNKIPEELLEKLSSTTDVDFQVKKLFGRNLFYLLLYGYLDSTRVSLRSLEDIYHSQKFKFLFNIDQDSTIKYNSISDRLASLNPEYFRMIYEYIYNLFSNQYSQDEAEQLSLVRVDSTMVAEASAKLREGIITGNQLVKKRQIKFTVSLAGFLPSGATIFSQAEGAHENNTIPQVILNHEDKSGIFVFDRGVSKRSVFTEFNKKDIKFIVRLSPNARCNIVSTNIVNIDKVNNLEIISDNYVKLLNKQHKQTEEFRLIRSVKEDNPTEEFCLLTNCFDLDIEQIISAYRKRWDIEVFFRFIKQELNFSHFLSTSSNGIKTVLYITLILSMLILIYKKENGLGYKTAVRRFKIELDELITKMLIVFAGGDPDLVFR